MKHKVGVVPGITEDEVNSAITWMMVSLESILYKVWYFKTTGAMDNEYRFDIEQR